MAELINAKCPNCGAVLELPANLDRAFCMHCGGKVIIAKDVHYHGGKTAIPCPECEGRGTWKCTAFHIITGGWKTETKWCTKGKCPRCGGSGKIESFWKRNIVEERDGICRLCKGSGKCPVCKGKGKIICEVCNGTGFKVYQGNKTG